MEHQETFPNMRIAVDARPLLKQKSGIGQYTYNLISSMAKVRNDNEFVLVYFHAFWESPETPRVRNDSGHVHPWPVPFLPHRLMRLIDSLQIPVIERFCPAIDIFHSPNGILPTLRKTKSVITIHDLTFLILPQYHPWIRNQFLTLTIDRSVRKAEKIIVDSSHTKEDLISFLKVPSAKVDVIPIAPAEQYRPLSPEVWKPVVEKYGLGGREYILFVGTLEPRKNLKRLVEAFYQLRKETSFPHVLCLVGGLGWKNEELFQTVRNLKLEEAVLMLGYVPDEDVPCLMNGAAAFLYPSVYEGFGLPPLEAMACGVPVVCSNTSSLPEVVGDAAIMVDPYKVEAIADALYRVLTDRELARRLAQEGLARARTFSWEETALKTLKVYEEAYAAA